MNSEANTPEEYISQLPEDRMKAMIMLRRVINENIPLGYKEVMSYGMVSYVIPHSIYPSGYHCNPKEPVPFISIASQKNYIAMYHMGIYFYTEISTWFQEEYAKKVKTKLDMGKSCIRFKKVDDIPYDLIAELCRKITLEDYLEKYQSVINKSTNK